MIEVQRAGDPQSGWARIDELFNAGAGATVDGRWSVPNRIILESTNVRRLSFDLSELPVDRRRSLAIRLDGQAIEVSPKHGVRLEFERGEAGVWSLVKQ
jgi:hypothetical protein